MTLLDYSQGTIPGKAIKEAGHEGTIRYITSPALMNPPRRNPKHMTRAEFQDHERNGLLTLFVYQGDITDADGGYAAGKVNAERVIAGMTHLGASVRPTFFTNDRTTLPDPAAWRRYLDGAASVLGRENVGAYGFGNAMDAARGHVNYFWQAGRESEVRPFTNIYQWNNGRVYVGGLECDLNRVLIPISIGKEEVDLTPEEHKALMNMYSAVGRMDPAVASMWGAMARLDEN